MMVKWENVNCIAVEWKNGVKTQFAQAANNVRVVGAQVASMTAFLMVNQCTITITKQQKKIQDY